MRCHVEVVWCGAMFIELVWCGVMFIELVWWGATFILGGVVQCHVY